MTAQCETCRCEASLDAWGRCRGCADATVIREPATATCSAGDGLLPRIEALVRSDGLRVPAVSVVAARLNELLTDPAVEPEQVVRLLEKEPALAARLLRLANSAFYRGLRPIRSLQDAVSRLGLRTVHATLTADAARSLGASLRAAPVRAAFEAAWRHALETGVAAREIARAIRFGQVELAFTCGLLHDVGELVLLRGIDDLGAEQDVDLSEGLLDEVLRLFHGPMGSKTLRAWRLPEPIPTVAELHHEPQNAVAEHERLVTIVHVADLLARDPRADGDEVSPRAMSRLGLTDVTLASVEVSLEDLGEELQDLL